MGKHVFRQSPLGEFRCEVCGFGVKADSDPGRLVPGDLATCESILDLAGIAASLDAMPPMVSCRHRGPVLREEQCSTCSKVRLIPIYHCFLHGECVARQFQQEPTYRSCASCPDATGDDAPLAVAPDDRPRVGIITPSLMLGGAERWIVQLIQQTRQAIHWVGVLAVPEATRESVVEEQVRALVPLYGVDLPAEQFFEKCEAVIVWGSVPQTETMLRASLNGRRLVVVSHGDDTARRLTERRAFQGRVIHVTRSLTSYAVEAIQASLTTATDFVAVSRAACGPYNGLVDPGMIQVLPNGIDTHRLEVHEPRSTYRERLGYRDGDFIVGSIGRLSGEKRLDVLVDAVAMSPAWVKLLLVGTGHREAEIRAAVAEKLPGRGVVLPGTTDVAPLYAAMDCAVITSPSEGFCFAALESLYAGVPLVAPPVGVLREFAEENGTCWQETAVGADAEEVARAIDAVRFTPRDVLDKRATTARTAILRDYTLEQFGRRWTRYLYQLLRPPKGDPMNPLTAATLACSVVIPVWNTPADWLSACVQSVLVQTGVRFEVILVDDGSTNLDTLRALAALTHRPQVRLFQQRHSGTGLALRLGVEVAQSPIIVRIDSDDVMPQGRLLEQAEWMAAHPEISLVAGQMDTIDASGKVTGELLRPVGEIADPYWETGWRINAPTTAARRSAILDVGNYTDACIEDADLFCRFSWHGKRMVVTDRKWALYRMHDEQTWRKDRTAAHDRMTEHYRTLWGQRRQAAEEQGIVKPGPDGQPIFGEQVR